MKIKHTKVTAASSPKAKIPAPFDKFYRLVSDKEFEELTGADAHPSPCEEAEGYNVKSYSYAVAKDEYEDALADNGLDIVELVTSDWDPNKLMLAYVVHDRIYPVDESELPEEADDLYDRDAGMMFIKDTFGIDDYDAYSIYDWYKDEGALDDFESWDDFIAYVEDDIYDMLDACDDQVQKDRILEAIEGSSNIHAHADISTDKPKKGVKASVDTGLEYWYLTKHGLGPGMLPNDVHVIDVIDNGWDTYVLIDKMLTTEELKYYDLKEKFPPEELMACDKVEAAECTKVDEDDDSIHYVVASEDDDPDWIVDYDLSKLPDEYWERHEDKRRQMELDDEADYYDRLHGEGDYEGDPHDVYGSDEVEKEEDFLDQPEQEFKSDKTAVNGKQGKLPAVFKKASIPNGGLVLDYGGGTPESEAVAQAYLDQFEAKEMLYDPFNQTAEHNRNVVKELRANGGADVAVCSNVLNVIKEEDVRIDLLNKIKKLLKSGAVAYISVYEGSGAGEGSATQNNESFQNNKKLGGYLEEVQRVFPEATKKGAVIIAPNTGSAKEAVASSTDISSINLNQLKADIVAGCEEYLTSPEGGFLPSGSLKEDRWDMTADEVYIVEINEQPEEGRIEVEVRAELGYSGMIRMSEILDKVIEQYDSEAYFEMVEPGIMDAYIFDNSVTGSTAIEGAEFDKWNDRMAEEHDRRMIDPPEYDEEDEDKEPLEEVEIDHDFDFVVNVDESGDWSEDRDEEGNLDDIDTESDLISLDTVIEDATDLLTWSIPSEAGKYKLQGHLHLEYKPEVGPLGNEVYVCNMKHSKITDLEITPAGKAEEKSKNEAIENSTEVVEAAMTDEDVEYAILNEKPFELEAFKRYSGETHDGEIKAEQVEVGDVIKINSAEVVDYGTIVKVLRINDPQDIETGDEFRDRFQFDYTFGCEAVEVPEDSTAVKVGDPVTLWYDAEEYVGELIPV